MHAAALPHPAQAQPPRQVLLFSGHMLDAPGRAVPRFPPAAVPQATEDIEALLAKLQAGPQDLALTQGANGGDLLFAEACLRRGVPLRLLLPLPEPAFLAASVLPAADGPAWAQRFQAVKAALAAPPAVLAKAPGDATSPHEVFVRCNLWLLDEALVHGPERLRFIALWNGQGGDAPGGTAHMAAEVRRRGGQVHLLAPRL